MAWMGTTTFDQTSKYKPTDINRVNRNVEAIRDLFNGVGFALVLPYPITASFSRYSFPWVVKFNDVRGNINYLKSQLPAITAPTVIVDNNRLQTFNFVNANDIELNLQAFKTMFDNLISSFRYCGDITTGTDFSL